MTKERPLGTKRIFKEMLRHERQVDKMVKKVNPELLSCPHWNFKTLIFTVWKRCEPINTKKNYPEVKVADIILHISKEISKEDKEKIVKGFEELYG